MMSQRPIPFSADEQGHHIYHIAFLLRQKLIPDLVSDVMDKAEIYWTTTTQTSLKRKVAVREGNAPKEIMRSDAVASPSRIQQPVRKVVFNISSHDQGWTSNPHDGSWTWFTAKKATPSEDDASMRVAIEATSRRFNLEQRELCRNPVAQRNWQMHEITLRADSQDIEEAEWVSFLKVGDVVALHAWAQFPGWVNVVQQASITFHTMAIV
ncbi:hypothetical protein WHR41_03249 [Cladosporium halotolerans]|uniref:Uncharacterized protein n=1 Tax=Cladosporium halotolerans TaxID=1052096 RepID=A0AB34KX41_9PEZI